MANGDYLVTACDICASIGEKSEDALYAPAMVVGAFTARTPLLELYAVGITPLTGVVTIGGESAPTGEKILAGVYQEMDQVLPLTISTEKNMPTTMTSVGISFHGVGQPIKVGGFKTGDEVWLVGHPCVGQAVLHHQGDLLNIHTVKKLVESEAVKEVLPVGSSGVLRECEDMVLADQASMHWFDHGLDLEASAGPSTAAVVVCSPGGLPKVLIPCKQIGTIEKTRFSD